MSNRRYRAYGAITIVLSIIVSATILPSHSTRFVLAAWEHPDEYGQGIDGFSIYENSTGSWEIVIFSWGFIFDHSDSEHEVIEWNASLFARFRVWYILNATLTGAIDENDGLNYFRHNTTVLDRNDNVVFNQENFTNHYHQATYGEIIWYRSDIVLNFLPLYGEYYTITIEYEVFW